MKKYISTICILLSFLNSNQRAQTGFGSNARWTQAFFSDQEGKIVRQIQYFVDRDSIINGKLFGNIIVQYPENPENLSYIGSVREESGKIYANIIIAEDTLEDILLYDFTLENGDIILGLPLSSTKEHFCELNETKIVTSIDSIKLLNGEKRKRINFNNVEPWIEGIGSISGLFNPAYPITTGLYSYQFISCFKQDNIELYYNNEWCNENCCELLTNLDQIQIKPKYSSIYPNSTKNFMLLKLNDLTIICNSIEIRDIFGRCIKTIPINHNCEYKLDLKDFTSGIYFILVQFSNKYELHKVIKL